MWKNSDDKIKAPFLAAHKAATEKYVEALHEYETNLTLDQVEIIAEHKNAEKAMKKTKKRQEKVCSHNSIFCACYLVYFCHFQSFNSLLRKQNLVNRRNHLMHSAYF